jgi:hypothetical protein
MDKGFVCKPPQVHKDIIALQDENKKKGHPWSIWEPDYASLPLVYLAQTAGYLSLCRQSCRFYLHL